MAVLNIHERALRASPTQVGGLLDDLAGADDRLWPGEHWPAMCFDRPLGPGAAGGHGPVRYVVTHHAPGQWVRFRFTAPRGFHGFHEFDVRPGHDGRTVLRHTIAMRVRGPAVLSWPLVFRPLHDAALEDAFDTAELALTGRVAHRARWSRYVRLLRGILRSRGDPAALGS